MKKEQKFVVTIECEVYARTVEEAQAKVCVLKNRIGSESEPEAHNLVLCDGSLYGKAYDANNSAVETIMGSSTDFEDAEDMQNEIDSTKLESAVNSYLQQESNIKALAEKIADKVADNEYECENDWFGTSVDLGGDFGYAEVEVFYDFDNDKISRVELQFTHDDVYGELCVSSDNKPFKASKDMQMLVSMSNDAIARQKAQNAA